MRIDIITLFPEFFEGLKTHSVIGRAVGNGTIEVVTHNLRDYSTDKYKTVDDRPYGGGPGMVLKVDVLHRALIDVRRKTSDESAKVILLTPQGQVYKQKIAQELAKESNLILICGHYEGFDERIREYVDLEISIGDYVLTGGEIPAMMIMDSIVRLLPGVLGDDASSVDESHSEGLLEYPQYTRPEEYDGKKVPAILLGGNHPKIEKWRREQAKERTKARRPDLLITKR
ncbi:MAG: tRNA (guanine-N(1)-)-methyltransferase [uncultured bacterium]|nr:MAG: tRNA (guanine-N(1)-)-methyltransferase [uncultured bacterium]KKU44720.1 MAG: tRNA (guanine-N(1)-)-methyltransferase [Microgenomates group bacterium GW2011_GWB1_46_7]KKU60059.1 MAG: tRNA (guanine-N(1)-)-methyltransferase [Microgenomates group bacterium GW2011_GWE1_47_12]KKU60857.1 MAG: tRNA (guanine-N(1)-)-methyltransferase [Microgenomates group bacterium GW2011_GWD1_47_13]OGD71164.1 MAG: tRNA (guanosine(37)-N1)-methyltransferase TrmD [Candidatus Collierbacteria bacterium RIFOXYA1_FULL_4